MTMVFVIRNFVVAQSPIGQRPNRPHGAGAVVPVCISATLTPR
jgi:hypothetical protein